MPKERSLPFDRNDYETPSWVYNALEVVFNFKVDLAANQYNTKCPEFYSEEQDSLKQPWHHSSSWLWINPPYSPLKPWIEKCQKEADLGAKIVVLVPPVVCTRYFAKRPPEQLFFITGRISFCHTGIELKGNRDDSCLMIFNRAFKPRVSWINHGDLQNFCRFMNSPNQLPRTES